MPSKDLGIEVHLPDAVLNFSVKRNTQVSDIFRQIRDTVSLRELWYFGLQCVNSKGQTKFMKLNRKVSSYEAPSSQSLKVFLKIRFYPEEVSELIEDITRRYFFYEIKDQIIGGKIYCSDDTALLLASYQAVVRYQKYNPAVHTGKYLDVEKFLPLHVLNSHNLSHEEWANKIARWHEEHGDMREYEAILEYLKVVQDLDMYGINYYEVTNKKKTQLWLGIHALGLNFYDHDDLLTPKINFSWSELRSLSFSNYKFTVKPPASVAADVTFFCDRKSTCKELLALCTGNHDMYRRRRLPDTIEVQQMKIQAKQIQLARDSERNRLAAEIQAREDAEKRFKMMELALQEQEEAYEKSRGTVADYERMVNDLKAQLAEAQRAQVDLQAMQHQLEEVNRKLERESMASETERDRLMSERDVVMQQIEMQNRMIQEKEKENRDLEAQVSEALKIRSVIGDAKSNSEERELQPIDGLARPEDDREVRALTDVDYAQRLKMMKLDLDTSRDRSKLLRVDLQHEDNIHQGRNKYNTLRQIRRGNTKQRVELFECL